MPLRTLYALLCQNRRHAHQFSHCMVDLAEPYLPFYRQTIVQMCPVLNYRHKRYDDCPVAIYRHVWMLFRFLEQMGLHWFFDSMVLHL